MSDFVTRKGVAVVTEKGIAVVVRMTQGRVKTYRPNPKGDAIERCLAGWKPAPGAYRVSFHGNFVRGFSMEGTPRKVNLQKTIAKLEESGKTPVPYISTMWGVKGYGQRANAAKASAEERRRESRYMAEDLKKLVEGGPEC